ncbi:MAG: hypothetical protein MHM6MM_001345 [Cercozoa sp. M6MM]
MMRSRHGHGSGNFEFDEVDQNAELYRADARSRLRVTQAARADLSEEATEEESMISEDTSDSLTTESAPVDPKFESPNLTFSQLTELKRSQSMVKLDGDVLLEGATKIAPKPAVPVMSDDTSSPSPKVPEVVVPDYQRVNITKKPKVGDELKHVQKLIGDAVSMRRKYVGKHHQRRAWHSQEPVDDLASLNMRRATYPPRSSHKFAMGNGVVKVWDDDSEIAAISAEEFFRDLHRVMRLVGNGPAKTFCYQRLQILESRFRLHRVLNEDVENAEQRVVPHRDFYNVRKVDNHVHHSACMTQKHLLRYIKSMLRRQPNTVVKIVDDPESPSGKRSMTLAELFESLQVPARQFTDGVIGGVSDGVIGESEGVIGIIADGVMMLDQLDAYDLSIDTLDMHAHQDTFHRFDKFNQKYNPIGESLLREVFLKTDNDMGGQFLAGLTHQVFDDHAAAKYQLAEYRLSIYGKRRDEWDKLGRWVVSHNLYSPNVVWLIQVPRLYEIYKSRNLISSFQDMIDNIFIPLFEVTIDPNSHKELHLFLRHVVGFDSVVFLLLFSRVVVFSLVVFFVVVFFVVVFFVVVVVDCCC